MFTGKFIFTSQQRRSLSSFKESERLSILTSITALSSVSELRKRLRLSFLLLLLQPNEKWESIQMPESYNLPPTTTYFVGQKNCSQIFCAISKAPNHRSSIQNSLKGLPKTVLNRTCASCNTIIVFVRESRLTKFTKFDKLI